jgi:hypothetical protein
MLASNPSATLMIVLVESYRTADAPARHKETRIIHSGGILLRI